MLSACVLADDREERSELSSDCVTAYAADGTRLIKATNEKMCLKNFTIER